MFYTAINVLMRVVDISFGVLGLLLVLRVILQLFNVSFSNPLLRFLVFVTDPVLSWVSRVLGIRTSVYQRGFSLSMDVLSGLATVVLLWVLHSLISWSFEIIVFFIYFLKDPWPRFGALLMLLVRVLFDLYALALLLRIVFDWLRVSSAGRLMRFLWNITEPVLAPIRRVLPTFGGWDFSPVIVFFLLRLMQSIVLAMLSWIFQN